jgi:hypothetical protein
VDIWEIALGFMDSQLLFAAERRGVFRRLAKGPCTAAEVSREVGLPERSTVRLLRMLCALELVRRRADDRYENGSEAAAQLVPEAPGYIGGLFAHLRDDLYPLWSKVDSALEEERAQWERSFPDRSAPLPKMFSDAAALEAFHDGMHAIAYGAARCLAGSEELAGIETLVDVGGGSAAFGIAVAEQYPALRVEVLDLPEVRPIAERRIGASDVAGRVRFRAADFWTDPVPEADAHALGFVLHDWEEEAGSRLLERIADAARPGGLLIVGEYLLDEDGCGPPFVTRQDLNMLVAARGRERTASEYAAWIGRYDYALERIQPAHGGKRFLIARRR